MTYRVTIESAGVEIEFKDKQDALDYTEKIKGQFDYTFEEIAPHVEIYHNEESEHGDHYEVTLVGSTEFDGDTFDEMADAEAYAQEIAEALDCEIIRKW